MKKFFLGIIVGFILLFLFIYSGGGDVIKMAGNRVKEVGTKSKQFEKDIKEGKEGIMKSIKEWKKGDTP